MYLLKVGFLSVFLEKFTLHFSHSKSEFLRSCKIGVSSIIFFGFAGPTFDWTGVYWAEICLPQSLPAHSIYQRFVSLFDFFCTLPNWKGNTTTIAWWWLLPFEVFRWVLGNGIPSTFSCHFKHLCLPKYSGSSFASPSHFVYVFFLSYEPYDSSLPGCYKKGILFKVWIKPTQSSLKEP